jgi:preprotein translocase subunit SecD
VSRACRLVVAALAVLALGACDGSGGDSARRPGIEVALQVYGRDGSEADRVAIRQAVAALKERLRALGATGAVTAAPDAARIRLRVDGADAARRDRVVTLATRGGELEFFDLEQDLVPPSRDSYGFPVATSSLYELLVERQPRIGEEDKVESWYLFDAGRELVAGPVPSKRLLLPTGSPPVGSRALGAPPRTVVLECGIGELVCPGRNELNPTTNSYYLIRFDPPEAPELDGSDVELEGTKHEFDPQTGEPIVIMQFTAAGAAAFGRVTRDAARRGRRLSRTIDETINQHFAIVLDREIKSWPSIDWQAYPDGISGEAGIQISGIGSLQEARDLAAVLQTGALPVRFDIVSRTPVG